MCLRDAITTLSWLLAPWAASASGGRSKQPISGTESRETEVETAWVGMGISSGPLVPLSYFSSSPRVDGLDLHRVGQLRPMVLEHREAFVF